MSKYLSILTLSLTLLIIGCENKQNGAIYRVTTYEFNPEKFDEMIAYTQGMKDDVLRIEGLNFGHICRTSENSAIIIAQYVDEEAMKKATPKFKEIMGGMRQFFTSPPNPAEAEIIWKSHN